MSWGLTDTLKRIYVTYIFPLYQKSEEWWNTKLWGFLIMH